jgi:hypothetical protein
MGEHCLTVCDAVMASAEGVQHIGCNATAQTGKYIFAVKLGRKLRFCLGATVTFVISEHLRTDVAGKVATVTGVTLVSERCHKRRVLIQGSFNIGNGSSHRKVTFIA